SPIGTETTPITSSAQISDQRSVIPAPSTIAARQPRSGELAGEIFDSNCIHSGSTDTAEQTPETTSNSPAGTKPSCAPFRPEVGPDHGADEQDRRHAVDVDVAALGLDALGDEDDRERVRDRPEEERDVPPDVALDQVDVALDHAAEPDELMAQREAHRPHAA